MAAQTMLLTANSINGGEALIRRLKPKPFSHFLLPPKAGSRPSSTTGIVAIFKAKTKADPVKKVSSILTFLALIIKNVCVCVCVQGKRLHVSPILFISCGL